jgi:hypothetical protein
MHFLLHTFYSLQSLPSSHLLIPWSFGFLSGTNHLDFLQRILICLSAFGSPVGGTCDEACECLTAYCLLFFDYPPSARPSARLTARPTASGCLHTLPLQLCPLPPIFLSSRPPITFGCSLCHCLLPTAYLTAVAYCLTANCLLLVAYMHSIPLPKCHYCHFTLISGLIYLTDISRSSLVLFGF